MIKKQTLLVGIICFSTVIFWGTRAIFMRGYFTGISDGIINISCVFVSKTYTGNYYKKLKCDKLSDKLCGCVEKYAISKLVQPQPKEGHLQCNNVIYVYMCVLLEKCFCVLYYCPNVLACKCLMYADLYRYWLSKVSCISEKILNVSKNNQMTI